MFLRGHVLESIIAALPYPNQAQDWNLDDRPDGSRISFTWRDIRYGVEFRHSLSVWTLDNGMATHDDRAILLESAIMRAYTDRFDRFDQQNKAFQQQAQAGHGATP